MANKETTAARKQARRDRELKLSNRPFEDVSENCRKSRMKRWRRHEYRNLSAAEKGKLLGSPSELGERQYGEACTPEHKRNRKARKFAILS